MESLWVSGIIPGICDTLTVMLFPGKPPVPCCQVLAAGLALQRRQSGQEAVMGLWGMTVVGRWPSLIALALAVHFQPLSQLGQRLLSVG